MWNPFIAAVFNSGAQARADLSARPPILGAGGLPSPIANQAAGGVTQPADDAATKQRPPSDWPPYPGASYRPPQNIGDGLASIGQSIADAYAWRDWQANQAGQNGAPMQIMPPAQVQGMAGASGLMGFNPFGDPADLPDLAARFGGP